jgi:hypothetical protein
MNDTAKVAHRLALLEGVSLTPTDLESVTAEIEELGRVVALLEDFCQSTPWIALPVQPSDKKG